VRAAVEAAVERLARAGVPSPRFDAEELAAHALGVERRELWSATARRRELRGVRRTAGRPRAAAAHHRAAWFRHLDPRGRPGSSCRGRRPRWWPARRIGGPRGLASPVVVDLGTGSGAIALAVADRGRRVPGCTPSRPTRRARLGRAQLRRLGVDLRLGDMATRSPTSTAPSTWW
jgi:release factor glutamine methyltransferase